MPYAAFDPDCDVLNNPEPRDLAQILAFCRKCKGQMVLLVGAPSRSRRFLCPQCNQKLLAAHVAKWEHVTGRRYSES